MTLTVNLRDLALRALHTFWQSFVAVVGVTYAASGLNVGQIVDVDSAKRFALALLAAVGAAALSALKTTIKNLTSTGAVTDTGPGTTADVVPAPEAPAEPAQPVVPPTT